MGVGRLITRHPIYFIWILCMQKTSSSSQITELLMVSWQVTLATLWGNLILGEFIHSLILLVTIRRQCPGNPCRNEETFQSLNPQQHFLTRSVTSAKDVSLSGTSSISCLLKRRNEQHQTSISIRLYSLQSVRHDDSKTANDILQHMASFQHHIMTKSLYPASGDKSHIANRVAEYDKFLLEGRLLTPI